MSFELEKVPIRITEGSKRAIMHQNFSERALKRCRGYVKDIVSELLDIKEDISSRVDEVLNKYPDLKATKTVKNNIKKDLTRWSDC